MQQRESSPAERRWGLSLAEKADLWVRWKAGESMSDIGRALGKQPGSIFTFLAVQGGIVRPPRRRAAHALTSAERVTASAAGQARPADVRGPAAAVRRVPA